MKRTGCGGNKSGKNRERTKDGATKGNKTELISAWRAV